MEHCKEKRKLMLTDQNDEQSTEQFDDIGA